MDLCSESDSDDSFTSGSDSDSSSVDIAAARNWCILDINNPSLAPPRFPFMEAPGIKCIFTDTSDPLQYFLKFFDKKILQEIVNQTNLFASQYFESNNLTPKSRCTNWIDTDEKEIFYFCHC